MSLRILSILVCTSLGLNSSDLMSPKSFECVISSLKKTYSIGETPQITVSIKNKTKKDVYLIGSLDGSEEKWRSPLCYFEIDSPGKRKAPTVGRCGNMNSLKETDFVWVKSGETFNPYQEGFFSSYEIARVENFQKTGRYKITFFYSIKSVDMATYFGDDNGASKKAIKKLFAQVPHFELKSNTIEIEMIQ